MAAIEMMKPFWIGGKNSATTINPVPFRAAVAITRAWKVGAFVPSSVKRITGVTKSQTLEEYVSSSSKEYRLNFVNDLFCKVIRMMTAMHMCAGVAVCNLHPSTITVNTVDDDLTLDIELGDVSKCVLLEAVRSVGGSIRLHDDDMCYAPEVWNQLCSDKDNSYFVCRVTGETVLKGINLQKYDSYCAGMVLESFLGDVDIDTVVQKVPEYIRRSIVRLTQSDPKVRATVTDIYLEMVCMGMMKDTLPDPPIHANVRGMSLPKSSWLPVIDMFFEATSDSAVAALATEMYRRYTATKGREPYPMETSVQVFLSLAKCVLHSDEGFIFDESLHRIAADIVYTLRFDLYRDTAVTMVLSQYDDCDMQQQPKIMHNVLKQALIESRADVLGAFQLYTSYMVYMAFDETQRLIVATLMLLLTTTEKQK